MNRIALALTFLSATALATLAHAALPTNLVTNGNFETNGGTGQLAGGITTLSSWTVQPVVVTSNTPAGSAPFSFIMDKNADSVGYPSVYSPPNIFHWGPNTPASQGGAVANGFGASPNGGFFFGSNGGYATAPLSQTINGLTVGTKYTLSFQWAASQHAGYSGATNQDWKVTFGAESVTTPVASIASHGFSGWQTYTHDFTATSTSQSLSFLAQGTPVGLEPMTLLDGVSLTVAPEPTTLTALAGVSTLILRRRRA